MKNTAIEINRELKTFDSLFSKIAYRHDASTVFSDLLTIKICCFGFGTNEALYHETIKRYSREELDTMAKLMAELLIIYSKAKADNRWVDPLGDFYEYLASKSKKSALGQFFTPPAVCNLMAMITVSADWDQTINEPCSGSGRMVLAMNNITKGCYYICQDLDPICCKMTVINCMMHEIKCEVHCMDVLRNDKIYTSYLVNHQFWKVKTPHVIQKPLS